MFYSRIARYLVGSREKQCGDDGDDLNTAVASHYRGEAVMRLSSQPYAKLNLVFSGATQTDSSVIREHASSMQYIKYLYNTYARILKKGVYSKPEK